MGQRAEVRRVVAVNLKVAIGRTAEQEIGRKIGQGTQCLCAVAGYPMRRGLRANQCRLGTVGRDLFWPQLVSCIAIAENACDNPAHAAARKRVENAAAWGAEPTIAKFSQHGVEY
jgi:hypothetical protein